MLLRYFASLRAPSLIGGCALVGLAVCEAVLFKKLAPPPWLGSFTAAVVYSLLVLLYISLVFGMGEGAVRIRLLREINSRPSRSATLGEILQAYNAEKILEIRLERLVSAGHLRFDGRHYQLGNPILLLQGLANRFLKFLLGITHKKQSGMF